MPQGRQALYALLNGETLQPPVVVPFGLDPFGWHGERESYREVCAFALEHCTLLPKVLPFGEPLAIGAGEQRIVCQYHREREGTLVRRYELRGAARTLSMEEVQTPGDASWKIRKRWIETEEELEIFLALGELAPARPDVEAVRRKERQLGAHGLPYVEVNDSFYTVCEMFPTDTFFIKTRTDLERIRELLAKTGQRILQRIETLCREAGCPFVLRLIGAEMSVPPFMSRDDFLFFQEPFYRRAVEVAHQYGIPAAFHCHGPIKDILDDIWGMGYDFIEPFEPPPRGNMTVAEALARTAGRGVVFGGVDEVILSTGAPAEVRAAVQCCLDGAAEAGGPYILAPSATPFYDPLPEAVKANLLLFMTLGTGAFPPPLAASTTAEPS